MYPEGNEPSGYCFYTAFIAGQGFHCRQSALSGKLKHIVEKERVACGLGIFNHVHATF